MRKSGVRQEIVDYLARNGAVEDPQGRATSQLRKALGFKGSEVGFTQVVAALQREGELTRDIKGKRTYRIGLVTTPEHDFAGSDHQVRRDGTTQSKTADPEEMDYQRLAVALLVQVTQTLSQEQPNQQEKIGAAAQRRIQTLENRNRALEREILQKSAEHKALTNEREELLERLKNSESNLALLADRMSQTKGPKRQISNLLQPEDRALLERLRSGSSKELKEATAL